MREKLEFKILGMGLSLLIIGVVAVSLLVFYFVKSDVYSVATERLEATARVITESIDRTMLEGNADSAKTLIRNLKSVSGFETIDVYNHEGKVAFTGEVHSGEAENLKKVYEGKTAFAAQRDDSIVFYMPLENRAQCRGCHPADIPVIGAVKISVSLAAERRKVMNFMIMVVLGSLLGAAVLGIIFWRVIRGFVVRPVRTLEANALRMSEGDLSFKTGIKTKDEIGKLDRSIKESLRSISSVLMRVKEIAGEISSATGSVEGESRKVLEGIQLEAEAVANISSSVEQLNAAITEIAEGTESLASSVEEIAASIEQMSASIGSVTEITSELSEGVEATSSSIEQMYATIKEVAESSDHLAKVSDETLSAVEEIIYSIKEVETSAKESAKLSEKVTKDASTLGVAAIDKTALGMQRIKTAVEKTASVIKKLGGRSDEIGKILNVIDDITDQTTLLALNAAILASQAREHGKGFSVVADEIKDLAERTAFSTQEIDTLIQSVRQEVRDAVDAMKDGLASVEEGLKLSAEASDAVKKILASSKMSSEMAAAIERSTGEQAKAARLVSDSIETVREMVGQIARATAEQSKGIAFVIVAVDKMKNSSLQVNNATQQQEASSRQMAQAIEIISDRSQQIARAINEQKLGSGQIRDSVDRIKNLPGENRDLTFKINKALRELSKDSDLLVTEMERFKLYEEKGAGVIKFGVVPLESPADMFRRFTPLADYLGRRLGKKIELKVATDFETAVKDLGQGVTQLCYMTPSTYIEAYRGYGVALLAKALREGRPFHRALVITKADSGIKSIRDIRNRSFAFGDAHSTSSHIVPRAMLLDAGIELQALSYYNYLGHHDDVVKAVIDGEFDAGGVMESAADKYKDMGLYYVQVSDEIPEFNICASASMGNSERGAVKSALVELGGRPEGAQILKAVDKSYTGFMEASDEDYNGVRAMMSKMGML
ncbi:MAG: phosphate/phosphite/phosphonate ABC transporter substrate-binding protein [Thermodesulfovibrionales bacterium]|nr:phosphate/phosphite/phosphonate ABC transporter substrate-binding protein [Thermodesulfovibrionales bacterium]